MRPIALAILFSTALAGSAVAEIRFELRAVIPADCGVVSVNPVGADATLLQLTTVCNSETFSIRLMGPDGPVDVIAVTSAQAAVSAAGNAMGVTLRAPGAQTFDVELADELADADQLSVQIIAG